MAEGVSVEVEILDGLVLVRVSGEVDAATVSTLEANLHLAEAGSRVLVDCRGVTFMDSTGLRSLLRHHMRLDAGGGSIRVVEPSACVRLLLSVSGLDWLIE